MSWSEMTRRYVRSLAGLKAAKALVQMVRLKKLYHGLRYFGIERYRNPSLEELEPIEKELKDYAEFLQDYEIDLEVFRQFKKSIPFPSAYLGGPANDVWDKKLLEHYIAYDLLSLGSFGKEEIYVDVAGDSSPWAKILRQVKGMNAYAVDLKIAQEYQGLSYF